MWRLRRSMMFFAGTNLEMLNTFSNLQPDSFMIDLEDYVPFEQKETARDLVFKAIKSANVGTREITVRINSLSTYLGMKDLEVITRAKPDAIIIPKVECAGDVLKVAGIVERIEKAEGFPEGSIQIHLMIETPAGIVNIDSIAQCHSRIGALIFGANDYTKETRGKKSTDRIELLYPLTRMLLAARVAGIDAIDTAYFDPKDIEGLIKHCQITANLGFDGKGVIHPAQIEPVHKIFMPSKDEVEFARRVIKAYEKGEREGRGAIIIDGKLIDQVHIKTARRTLSLANQAGVL